MRPWFFAMQRENLGMAALVADKTQHDSYFSCILHSDGGDVLGGVEGIGGNAVL